MKRRSRFLWTRTSFARALQFAENEANEIVGNILKQQLILANDPGVPLDYTDRLSIPEFNRLVEVVNEIYRERREAQERSLGTQGRAPSGTIAWARLG